jgi:transcription initiation factor TFIIIB Brf1 subunit/transcription initiation factor TFIIB
LKDINGNQLNSKQQVLYKRLNRINNSLINTLERNLKEAERIFKNICSRLIIPDYVKDDAWKTYSEIAKRKLTAGRSISVLVCAAIYLSMRSYCFPITYEELSEISNNNVKKINNGVKIIVQAEIPNFHLNFKPIDPQLLITKFSNDLEVKFKYQVKAMKLCDRLKKYSFIFEGKDPKGLAAAIIYLILKPTIERKSQKEIAAATYTTEVTIRSRVRLILKLLNLDEIKNKEVIRCVQ